MGSPARPSAAMTETAQRYRWDARDGHARGCTEARALEPIGEKRAAGATLGPLPLPLHHFFLLNYFVACAPAPAVIQNMKVPA